MYLNPTSWCGPLPEVTLVLVERPLLATCSLQAAVGGGGFSLYFFERSSSASLSTGEMVHKVMSSTLIESLSVLLTLTPST